MLRTPAVRRQTPAVLPAPAASCGGLDRARAGWRLRQDCARASSGPKIPRGKPGRIYGTGNLSADTFCFLFRFIGLGVVVTGVVSVLIVVIGVVIGILALEVNVIQNHPKDMNPGVMDALNGLAGVIAADLVELGDEDHAVGERGDNQRVADRGNGRTIEYHAVVAGADFFEELPH